MPVGINSDFSYIKKRGFPSGKPPLIFFGSKLAEQSTFLQFASSFADLESVVIDLDLVVSFLEIGTLLPGKLNRSFLASFDLYGNLSGEWLFTILTGCERTGTQCFLRNR